VRVVFLTTVVTLYTLLVIYLETYESYLLHLTMLWMFVYQAHYLAEGLWEFHLSRRRELGRESARGSGDSGKAP
jgi:hypothetical protein